MKRIFGDDNLDILLNLRAGYLWSAFTTHGHGFCYINTHNQTWVIQIILTDKTTRVYFQGGRPRSSSKIVIHTKKPSIVTRFFGKVEKRLKKKNTN